MHVCVCVCVCVCVLFERVLCARIHDSFVSFGLMKVDCCILTGDNLATAWIWYRARIPTHDSKRARR